MVSEPHNQRISGVRSTCVEALVQFSTFALQCVSLCVSLCLTFSLSLCLTVCLTVSHVLTALCLTVAVYLTVAVCLTAANNLLGCSFGRSNRLSGTIYPSGTITSIGIARTKVSGVEDASDSTDERHTDKARGTADFHMCCIRAASSISDQLTDTSALTTADSII